MSWSWSCYTMNHLQWDKNKLYNPTAEFSTLTFWSVKNPMQCSCQDITHHCCWIRGKDAFGWFWSGLWSILMKSSYSPNSKQGANLRWKLLLHFKTFRYSTKMDLNLFLAWWQAQKLTWKHPVLDSDTALRDSVGECNTEEQETVWGSKENSKKR